MTEQEIWDEVILESIKSGISHEHAIKAANAVITARRGESEAAKPSRKVTHTGHRIANFDVVHDNDMPHNQIRMSAEGWVQLRTLFPF